jgi:hypothetical protein
MAQNMPAGESFSAIAKKACLPSQFSPSPVGPGLTDDVLSGGKANGPGRAPAGSEDNQGRRRSSTAVVLTKDRN